MATSALIRTGTVFPLLHPSCLSGAFHLTPNVFLMSLGTRWTSTDPHVAGRMKLNLQENATLDTSSIKELPMRYYFNRNPRSPELLGVEEKPRGFGTAKRRVDYYHRYIYLKCVAVGIKKNVCIFNAQINVGNFFKTCVCLCESQQRYQGCGGLHKRILYLPPSLQDL